MAMSQAASSSETTQFTCVQVQKIFKGSKIVGSAFPIVIVTLKQGVQEISSFETSLGATAVPSTLRRLTSGVRPLVVTDDCCLGLDLLLPLRPTSALLCCA